MTREARRFASAGKDTRGRSPASKRDLCTRSGFSPALVPMHGPLLAVFGWRECDLNLRGAGLPVCQRACRSGAAAPAGAAQRGDRAGRWREPRLHYGSAAAAADCAVR